VAMARRARVSAWKLGGLSVRELGRRVWSEVNDDEVTDRAAALSYYFLFALFPALLFLTALLGYLPVEGLQERLLAYARDVLPADAASTMERTLTEIVTERRGGLLSIGVLAALWASSNGMASVMSTMNKVWGVAEQRSWWWRRLLAIGLTLGFSAFIIGSLLLMVFGGVIGGAVANTFGFGDVFKVLWNAISIPLVIVCALFGIELIYYVAPAGPRQWQWITPGAALALASWLAMSFGLRLWVSKFADYSATYGSIGGVILLMLWLYLTSVVLLVGAELDAEIEAAARQAPELAPRAARAA
jgi:membrane protein